MNLNELANRILFNRPGDFDGERFPDMHREKSKRHFGRRRSLEYTQLFKEFAEIFNDERQAATILASQFWQTILSTGNLTRFFQYNGIASKIKLGEQTRTILNISTFEGRSRYDLIFLSDEVKSSLSIDVEEVLELYNGGLHGMARDWLRLQMSEYQYALYSGDVDTDALQRKRSVINTLAQNEERVLQLMNVDFSILVAPMPKMIRTSGIASPACGIAISDHTPAISSAGAFASTRSGMNGVTASLHGVVDNPDILVDLYNQMGNACVIGKQVFINGQKGTIRSADLITDSCFIELDSNGFSVSRSKGPLIERYPYVPEPVTFDGITSHRKSTVVTNVDIGLCSSRPTRQSRIYTNAVTNPGDSGAALYNNENHILGFSHYRTGYGEQIEFSEWIWADSVFNSLKLQY